MVEELIEEATWLNADSSIGEVMECEIEVWQFFGFSRFRD
jgi:hypothetical protein